MSRSTTPLPKEFIRKCGITHSWSEENAPWTLIFSLKALDHRSVDPAIVLTEEQWSEAEYGIGIPRDMILEHIMEERSKRTFFMNEVQTQCFITLERNPLGCPILGATLKNSVVGWSDDVRLYFAEQFGEMLSRKSLEYREEHARYHGVSLDELPYHMAMCKEWSIEALGRLKEDYQLRVVERLYQLSLPPRYSARSPDQLTPNPDSPMSEVRH